MEYSREDVTNINYDIQHVEDNTIYLSYSENSFPHKIYMDMKEEFKLSLRSYRDKRVDDGMHSDNESNNIGPNNKKSLSGRESTPESLRTNVLSHPQLVFTDNKSNTKSAEAHIIPMSMDIATQFNSDMKIIIKQDSKDSSVINIKFGGPITGNVEGSGQMPKSDFVSLLNEKVSEQIRQETTKLIIEDQMTDKTMTVPAESNTDVIKPGGSREFSKKIDKRSSLGSEESLNYIASKIPSESVVKRHQDLGQGRLSQKATGSPEMVSTQKAFSEDLTSTYNVGSTRATVGEYAEPFSNPTTVTSVFPSFPKTSSKDLAVPAVLPKCIVRRITRAMINDLNTRKMSTSSLYDLEKKIISLNFGAEISNQNWHAAIKRGKIMIGEIIELIITVNIDQVTKKEDQIRSIFADLKMELINACFYLLSLLEQTQINDTLCLQLIIDIVREEIDKLTQLVKDWIVTGCKPNLSTFFIDTFSRLMSQHNSESSAESEPLSASIEDVKTTTAVESRPLKSGTIKISDKRPQKKVSDIIDVNLTATKEEMSSRDSKTLKNSQGMYTDSSVVSQNKSEGIGEKEESKSTKSIQRLYKDPSVITNSRVAKTMTIILQAALDEDLTNVKVSKSIRNKALQVEIANDQPMVTKNNDLSVMRELVTVDGKWSIPIQTGKFSIQDLIEFIINTSSQNKTASKELFNDILEELNQLEKELLFSVANNLYKSRNSDKELIILCYEILAELIFQEIAIAKYVFASLDTETIGATSLPLGKLYRTYIWQDDGLPLRINDVSRNVDGQQVSVAKSSTVKEDPKQMVRKSLSKEPRTTEKTISGTKRSSVEISESYVNKTSDIQSIKDNRSKSTNGNQDSEIKRGSSRNGTQVPNSEHKFTTDENDTLLIIIDKLNNQTREINKIKENLQDLTGKVEERFSQWQCNFSLDKVNEYCSYNNVNSSELHFAEATKIYNTQEMVQPGSLPLTRVQPSYFQPVGSVHTPAAKTESRSYVSPISDKTTEEPIKQRLLETVLTENLHTVDILSLVAEGSFKLLTNSQEGHSVELLSRRDSCREINAEFESIFQWIVGKYHETVNGLLQTDDGSAFVRSLRAMSDKERRTVEKEMIDNIVRENNLTIDTWVKEICYQRFLNCLSPTI